MGINISNAQGNINAISRNDKALRNANAQIASGLKNPNPATDPSASVQSKSIEGSLTITKRISSIAQQANNTLQIADTVLNANAEILSQMRAQAIAAANGTNTILDRGSFNSSFQQKLALITENAEAKWGSRALLDGTFSMNYQISSITKEANVVGSPIMYDLNAGDLTINGQDIGTVTGDAKDMAAAINGFSSITQVTASAFTTATGSGNFDNIVAINPSIIINGVTVPLGEFAGTESSNQSVDQAMAAINSFDELSDQHVVAENVGGFLQIKTTDGSNLSIGYRNIAALNVLGPRAGDYVGSITLSSVTSITVGGNAPDNVGLTAGLTQASGVKTISLADMRAEALFDSSLPDVSTQSNAQAALAAIDAALNKVLDEITKIADTVKEFENIEENMAEVALGLHDDLAAIRDLDFPDAIMDAEKYKALKQAGLAVLQTDLDDLIKQGNFVKDSLDALRRS